MAHVAQALFISLIVSAAALFLVRAGGAALYCLYTRPLLLWSVTAVAITAFLLSRDRWRSIDGRGLVHFLVVAVVAFFGLVILSETYRLLRRARTRRR